MLVIAMLLSFAGCDLDTYDYDDKSSIQSSQTTLDNESKISSQTNGNNGQEETNSNPSSTTSVETNNIGIVGSGSAKPVDPAFLPAYIIESLSVPQHVMQQAVCI